MRLSTFLGAFVATIAVYFSNAEIAVYAQSPNWVDSRLPIRDGLQVWLDASTLNDARKANQLAALDDSKPIDRWPDGSGNQRDFLQTDAKNQPKLTRVGERWSVRFDGEADNLRCISRAGTIKAATLIMVAAPHQNLGEFRGLFAANAPDQRDYQSGFNLDLGPASTVSFDQINFEGKGFSGARDLHDKGQPFGLLQMIEAVINPEARQCEVYVEGQLAGKRPFEPGELSIDQLTLAARFYTNGPGEHIVRGPLATDIAEVLLFDRVLTSDETKSVRSYLNKKHAALAEQLPKQLRLPSAGVPLVKVENPPPIQMLVPGFQVVELPVDLTNVNNVRFREDGKLVTLGYNGDIHLLSDTNGDGLEDQAHLFWKNEGSVRGPIGLQLTPPGYAKGRGMFMPSKGKVSLIVDTNGDDKADEEIVVASGWKEIPQNVDAVGIAMDKDGSLYFGLGTANYANAYQVDDQGKAAYDLKSDRGTVQRISPDFKEREIVCTGIRFPIAFAFNRNGDLFCSEQEGATWLPNGNPLDELLHIQPGRHYGFPPRHPQYNPGVIDEPSTFDYGPQHQSTCGMVFNQSVNGGPTFGPPQWAEDVIMCGESRGKIWRTKLVKTDVGYVAASQLLACLQMLTVDACVAPNGDLVVACHSGPPDWGTGPTGKGKLFRIKMAQQSAPQPVAVWPETSNEIRIAFDRPLDPLKMRKLADQVHIEYGDYVRAGDRFEGLAPPYAVVRRQSVAPRYSLPVAGVSLTNDLRTMIVSTAMMDTRGYYAVTIPRADDVAGERSELARTDLDFAIHGAQVEWKPTASSANGDAPVIAGWIPHLDLKVARELTQGSVQHENLWAALSRPGTLTIRTRVNLRDVLRPAIQLGGSIDYKWPKEEATLTLKSAQSMTVVSKNSSKAQVNSQSGKLVQVKTNSDEMELISVEITMATGQTSGIPELMLSTSTNEDSRERPVQLHRLYMPWIPSKPADKTEQVAPIKIAELEGGNWGRGRRVFHSEESGCFKCHAVGSVGAIIGPNLTNLVHRDYASVMRDIVNPSFAINPDYIGHVVALENGEVLTGVLRDEGGELLLGDAKGNTIKLDRSKIAQMKPAQVSVMPAGLHEKLSKDQLRDLMTYLMMPAPTMPLDAPIKAPPIRTEAEVAAALAGSTPLPEKLRQLNIVLVAGKKDHGPGEHDYPAWQKQWEQLLTAGRNIDISLAWDFPSDEQIAKADLLLFFQKGTWNDDRAKKLDAYLMRGGGAVYMHWAVNGDDRVADFSTRIGLASKGGSIRYRHGPLSLELHNKDNPILRNLSTMDLYDESYWLLTGDVGKVTLLASSKEDDAPQPQIWTYEKGDGRVFVSIPGHYNWTFDDPLFRILLFRGIAWCAKEPIDRFNELVPLGARMRQ